MGIDVYLLWKGQTEAERQAQYTGFDTTAGNVGYLREAYHGAPYATRVLVPEAFECEAEQGVAIPATILRARLPETLLTVAERYRKVYQEDVPEQHPALRSFVEFVELAEKLEAAGKAVRVAASW